MKKLRLLIPAILLVFSAFSLLSERASAQVIDSRWSQPFQVSNPEASAGAPYMTTDKFGYLHLFWAETGLSQGRDTVKYMRFDGEIWEGPVEIFLSNVNSAVSHISVTTDASGRLHLAWIELNQVFHSSAPAFNALNARNWDPLTRLPMQATFLELRVNDAGDLNVVYSQNSIPGLHGVYFQHSPDGGFTWSEAARLDPDKPNHYDPALVKFEIDDRGGFHAVWYYLDLSLFFSASGDWVRYSQSTDAGETWMVPFTIDIADEDPDELRMPLPALVTSGSQVHVVYAGDAQVHREHRYSSDYGLTWSVTRQIFGELMGQARGDGLAVDSLGRVHFIGNIRWPTALYYSMFSEGSWSPVNLVYLISLSADAPDTGTISAHDIRLAIQGGNYLVTAFGDTPGAQNRGLYVMSHRLSDAPAIAPLPTPTAMPTATRAPTSTPAPTATPFLPTPTALPEGFDIQSTQTPVVTPGYSVLVSFMAAATFVGGIFLFMRLRARRS